MARKLIADYLREVADNVESGRYNLPEVYDALTRFVQEKDARAQLPEYRTIKDRAQPVVSQ